MDFDIAQAAVCLLVASVVAFVCGIALCGLSWEFDDDVMVRSRKIGWALIFASLFTGILSAGLV